MTMKKIYQVIERDIGTPNESTYAVFDSRVEADKLVAYLAMPLAYIVREQAIFSSVDEYHDSFLSPL